MYTFQGKSISAHLTRLAQHGNKPFSAMLNPDVEGVLGIRVPQLRALAKSIAADASWREYVANADTEYMESRMLHGMVIGYVSGISLESRFALIREWVSRINSWSVCDCACSSFKLKKSECAAVKNQIKRFKKLNDLIRTGDYYRLSDPTSDRYFTAWQFAASDGSEALMNVVVTHPQANALPVHICFHGLDENAIYTLDSVDYFGAQTAQVEESIRKGMKFSGSMLMYAGLVLPQMAGDYPSVQLHLTRKG